MILHIQIWRCIIGNWICFEALEHDEVECLGFVRLKVQYFLFAVSVSVLSILTFYISVKAKHNPLL